MKEKAINFSAEMALAVWEGRKTQTMRVMKPQPVKLPEGAYCDPYNHDYSAFTFWTSENKMLNGQAGSIKNTCHWKSPYQPGDRLWVREPWRTIKWFDGMTVTEIKKDCLKLGDKKPSTPIYYESNNEFLFNMEAWANAPELRPANRMPRWASRITLEVESVSVMRVQEITEEEAFAEGVDVFDGLIDEADLCRLAKKMNIPATEARVYFAVIWNLFYGRDAWDRNDWCFKIKFRRV